MLAERTTRPGLVALAGAALVCAGAAACGNERQDTHSTVESLVSPEAVADGLERLRGVGSPSVVHTWDFRDPQTIEEWVLPEGIVATHEAEGTRLTVSAGAGMMHVKDRVPPGANALAMRGRFGGAVNPDFGGESHSMSTVWWNSEAGKGSVWKTVYAGEEFEEHVFMLAGNATWNQAPTYFGWSPVNVNSDFAPTQLLLDRVELIHLPPSAVFSSTGYTQESPRWQIGEESKLAVVGPPGFAWRREGLTLGENERVRVGGLLDGLVALDGSALRFEVAVIRGKKRDVVLSEELSYRAIEGIATFERDVDLAKWEGETVALELALQKPSEGTAAHGGVWIEPRLVRDVEVSARPRRIVLVTIDTLRADYLSVYGRDDTKTPFFEELASRGTLFENCYSTTTTTNPSHASILTSLHVLDHNVSDNGTALSSSAQTLPEMLSPVGYRGVGVVAAVHMMHRNSGLGQGFGVHSAPLGHPPRTGEEINEMALAFARDQGGARFFLWAHYFDVHAPYEPPPGYDRMYYEGDEKDPSHPGLNATSLPDDWENIGYWSFLLGVRDPAFPIAQYRAGITYADDNLRALFEGLTGDGHEDTLFVVTSDHGESMGEHGLYYEHGGLYDPVTHVPLLLFGPGIPAGVRVSDVVSTVDIVPTILDYAGVRAAARARGRSLREVIEGRAEPRPAVLEDLPWTLGVRDGDFKYMSGGGVMLFDLSADPAELDNVEAQHPDSVSAMQEYLDRRREARYVDLQPDDRELDPEMMRMLEEIGYAGD